MANARSLLRFAVPALATAVFAGLYALHLFGHNALYSGILTRWGVAPFATPFLDTQFVLSSLECAHRGVDVYLHDPCDVLARPFNYSPVLLWAQALGLGVRDTQGAGLTIDGLFLVSLAALPPPRDWAQGAGMLLASLSTATAFALERANLDLLIFALVMVIATLLRRSSRVRLLAFVAIGIATLIKFYPVTLTIAALRERPQRCVALGAIFAAGLAILAIADRSALALVFANLPKRVYFGDMFGAGNLPHGLASVLPWIAAAPMQLALIAATITSAAWLAFRPALRAAWTALDPAEASFLVVGCALLTGCFFAGGNVGYRAVFLILVLPGLHRLSQSAESAAARALFSITVLLVIFVMWGEFFGAAIAGSFPGFWPRFGFWLVRELAWWWVIGVMASLLLRFAWDSETGRVGLRRPFLKPTVSAAE